EEGWSEPACAPEHGRERSVEMGLKRSDLIWLGGIGPQEAFRQTHDAELQAFDPADLVALAGDDLDTPATHVDDDRPLAAKVYRVRRGEEDEPCLLDSGDHVDVEPESVPHAQSELAAVLCLPNRAGGHGQHWVGPLLFREALEGLERTKADVDRGGRQASSAERRAPEAHHLFLAIDDLEARASDPRDNHVNRVRADVDRGN